MQSSPERLLSKLFFQIVQEMMTELNQQTTPVVVIVGGGAAGCFAAITCKESAPQCKVILLEKSDRLLHKVSLSGGGRCNCSTTNMEKRNLAMYYPRGAKFLQGVFTKFNEQNTMEWFESRGVSLKTEPDGRIFPRSDKSSSITEHLEKTLNNLQVEILKNCSMQTLQQLENNAGFHIILDNNATIDCQAVCITTGGTVNTGGIIAAQNFGHNIEEQIPSLFSFRIADQRLNTIPGIAVQNVAISLPATKYAVRGDLLITHNGISGPAVIKLSSYTARDLYSHNYNTDCRINWCPQYDADYLFNALDVCRKDLSKKQIILQPVIKLPSRLWKMIVLSAGCSEELQWGHLSNHQREMIVQNLTRFTCRISGRDSNKDEFVTCGGVSCSQINASTMESRIIPGLYFAGEVIDIDGITGGYNLQAAWSTGYVAGSSIAQRHTICTPCRD